MAKQKKTYADGDLSHPKWFRFKKRILRLRGDQCQRCSNGDDLHLHHKVYHEGHRAWEYDESEIELLCAICHGHEHGYLKRCDYLGCDVPISNHFEYCYKHKILIEEERNESEKKRLHEESRRIIAQKEAMDAEIQRRQKDLENERVQTNRQLEILKDQIHDHKITEANAFQKKDQATRQLRERQLELESLEMERTAHIEKLRIVALEQTRLERDRIIKEGETHKAEKLNESRIIIKEAETRRQTEINESKREQDRIIREAEKHKAEKLNESKIIIKKADEHQWNTLKRTAAIVIFLGVVLFVYASMAIFIRSKAKKMGQASAAIQQVPSSTSGRTVLAPNPPKTVKPSEPISAAMPGQLTNSNADLRANAVSKSVAPPADSIRTAEEPVPKIHEEVGGHLECPRKECEGTMVLKTGKNGRFYGCSNFPNCRMTIDHPFACYKCGAEMVLREGKNGKFWGCSTFPDCRHTNGYK